MLVGPRATPKFGPRRRTPRKAGDKFAKHDADRNGSLSAAEVEGTRLAAHFAAIDADGKTRDRREKQARSENEDSNESIKGSG